MSCGSDLGITSSPPSTGEVSGDYLKLIRGFARGEPTLLSTEQQYKPQFIDLSLGDLGQTLNGSNGTAGLTQNYLSLLPTFMQSGNTTLNGMAAAAPTAAGAVQSITPGQSDLVKQLTQTASTQLAAGSRLDPNTVSNITQGVRSDWSNRGLGTSAPAQLDEAMQLEGAGQNVLNQRIGNAAAAQQAANQEQTTNYMTLVNPALSWTSNTLGNSQQDALGFLTGANSMARGAAPTLIDPSQAYDMFNTTYNATSASNISNAQNISAIYSAMINAAGNIGGAAL